MAKQPFHLELKNIKVSEFASQETYCYQASLYLNGRRIATVSNDGHGGCDYQHFVDHSSEKLVTEHFQAMQNETLEFWCCDQIQNHLILKDAKRMAAKARKKIFFVGPETSPGSYGFFNLPYTVENLEKLKGHLAAKRRVAFIIEPEFIIANPIDWLEIAHAKSAKLA